MEQHQFAIAIDKLEITYTATPNVLQFFSEIGDGGIRNYPSFYLIRKRSLFYKFEAEIFVVEEEPTGLTIHTHFADLRFGTYNPHRQNIYLVYLNRSLYDRDFLSFRNIIAKQLGLKFCRVSKLDLACDFNFRVSDNFKQLVTDNSEVGVVIKRKKCNGKQKVQQMPEVAIGGVTKQIFVKGGNNLEMKIYHKDEEIAVHAKQFIEKSVSFPIKDRIEVSFPSVKSLQSTLSRIGMTQEELYGNLENEAALFDIFTGGIDRIIRISQGRSSVNLFEYLETLMNVKFVLNDRINQPHIFLPNPYTDNEMENTKQEEKQPQQQNNSILSLIDIKSMTNTEKIIAFIEELKRIDADDDNHRFNGFRCQEAYESYLSQWYGVIDWLSIDDCTGSKIKVLLKDCDWFLYTQIDFLQGVVADKSKDGHLVKEVEWERCVCNCLGSQRFYVRKIMEMVGGELYAPNSPSEELEIKKEHVEIAENVEKENIKESGWYNIDEICQKYPILSKSNVKSRQWRLANNFPQNNQYKGKQLFNGKAVEEWLNTYDKFNTISRGDLKNQNLNPRKK